MVDVTVASVCCRIAFLKIGIGILECKDIWCDIDVVPRPKFTIERVIIVVHRELGAFQMGDPP